MLYLGADHNGFALKEKLKRHLSALGLAIFDCGAFKLEKVDDYVDFAQAVSKKIGAGDLGILVCGSGHGMIIAANKSPGIRAILPASPASARAGRHDDHANVLVLAARQMSLAAAKKTLHAFLSVKPDKAPRYLRRLKKIKALER